MSEKLEILFETSDHFPAALHSTSVSMAVATSITRMLARPHIPPCPSPKPPLKGDEGDEDGTHKGHIASPRSNLMMIFRTVLEKRWL